MEAGQQSNVLLYEELASKPPCTADARQPYVVVYVYVCVYAVWVQAY